MRGLGRWAKARARTATIAPLAVAALLGACRRGPGGTFVHSASRLSAEDSLALSAVAAVRGEEVGTLDPASLETKSESSQVVPGLVYYRSVYTPRGSAHMASVVILARRDTQLVILRTPEDFTAVSGGWIPDSPDGASRLCGELAAALGHASASVSRPVVFEHADDWRKVGFAPPGPPWRSQVGAPQVTQAAGQWIVQLWVAEPGRMARYECKLQTGASPHLEVTDSIPGAGFPPEKP